MNPKRCIPKTRLYLSGLFLLGLFLVAGSLAPLAATSVIMIDDFSVDPAGQEVPAGWKSLTFLGKPHHTMYSIVKDGAGMCLKAESHDAASAIYKEIHIDLKKHPVLAWKWKIGGVLKNGDARYQHGDDYAARIYVAFEFQPAKATIYEKVRHRILKALYRVEPPGKAITYIWANRLPKGSFVPNAFSSDMMMVAVESGPGKAGKWVSEERNIYDDYKRFFKDEPPLLSGVVVMTDTDNTRESAVGWYADIMFKDGL